MKSLLIILPSSQSDTVVISRTDKIIQKKKKKKNLQNLEILENLVQYIIDAFRLILRYSRGWK